MAVQGAIDPLEKAQAEALRGCDAGLVVYNLAADMLRAAIVFAPEMPLKDATTMLPLCGVGFQNALGALAPPEVAVHLEWAGGIRINGASCGGLHVAASDDDPETVPQWLVVGLTLPILPISEDTGLTPDQTALYAEGCADVDPAALLEAWVKHSLVGINTWDSAGPQSLHAEWRGLAHGIGEPVKIAGLQGSFLGVDERFGMLIRNNETTHLVPLTFLLDHGEP